MEQTMQALGFSRYGGVEVLEPLILAVPNPGPNELRIKVEAGQRLLVHGASGGVGSFAVQIGKAMGAEVTAAASGRNRELVAGLGADAVLDYTAEDVTAARERYDVIFDAVNVLSFGTMRPALRPGGVMVSVNPFIEKCRRPGWRASAAGGGCARCLYSRAAPTLNSSPGGSPPEGYDRCSTEPTRSPRRARRTCTAQAVGPAANWWYWSTRSSPPRRSAPLSPPARKRPLPARRRCSAATSEEIDIWPVLALLLARFEQAEQLGDAGLARLGSPGTLDPADIAVAIKGRQRLEKGPGLRLALEGGNNIGCERVGLRPFRAQLDLHLRARRHAVVTPPGRANRQKILAAIRAKRATHSTAIDRASDVMALFYTPDLIRIKGERDQRSATGFGNSRLETLCRHAYPLWLT